MTPEAGDLAYGHVDGLKSVHTTTAVAAGNGLKVVASSSGIADINVAKAAPADMVLGVVVRSVNKKAWEADSMCNVAETGAVVWFAASAAITAGALVELTAVDGTVKAAAGVNPSLGTALTTALVAGDLIKVEINPLLPPVAVE
jgi:hypothetical protein